MVGKIRPGALDKPAPSLAVIQKAFYLLLKYGTFRWSREDGFKITLHDKEQFKAFTIQAVKDKRLTKGRWFKQTWVGFVTLSRMVRVFLQHCVRNGALTFDLVISKCLSVVLVAALGSRSGNVARANGYRGTEYVQYRHVELYLEAGSGCGFQDLRATVTLEYTKGHKDSGNQSVVRYLRPLDADSIHVCPIALLLVHALRHGLVHGTTLEEVLAHTAARPDLHVEWKYPERPVLTAVSRTRPVRCELDSVSEGRQVRTAIKQMGLVSGMLSRVYAHSLRLGALRDHAHLTKKASTTLPGTEDVRRVAGHTYTSMQKGTTDAYIGDVARDYYNDRAENGGVHHRLEPKFALAGGDAYREAVQKRVTVEEMQAYADKHKPGQDASSLRGAERRTLQEGVRRERREALATSLPAEPVAARRTASNPAAAPPYPAPAPPPRPPSKKTPYAKRDDPVEAAQEPPHTAPPPAAPPTTTPSEEDLVFLSNIDPALLDEDTLASLEVAKADADALQAAILPTPAPEAAGSAGTDEKQGSATGEGDGFGDLPEDLRGIASEAAIQGNIEEAARVLLGHEEEDDDDGESPPPAWTASKDPPEWINGYAKYNVVNNASFADEWRSFSEEKASFADSIGHHSTRGNSRDEPTPHIFNCQRTKGCTYSAIKVCLIQQHERSCNESLVEARNKELAQPAAGILKCTQPGCAFETSGGEKSLKKHVTRAHGWTPRTCDDCDDEVVYQTSAAYETHRTNAHSGRWPSKCLFPGCPETKEFGTRPTMVYHLKVKHGLSTAEAVLPYLPPAQRKRWLRQVCVVPTCTVKTLFHSKGHMVVHLTSVHKMEDEEANALVVREARKETYVPENKAVGPAGNAKKRTNQRASFVAPGKENDPSPFSPPPPTATDGVQKKHGEQGAEPARKKPRAQKK